MGSRNLPFDSLETLRGTPSTTHLFRLSKLAESAGVSMESVPYSQRILLEAALRQSRQLAIGEEELIALARSTTDCLDTAKAVVPFLPGRILLQDFTGVPAIVDLAAMRSAMARAGADPARINPTIPVDLVIDHSVQVDAFGSEDALARNAELELTRNRERYEFLKWGQRAFRGFRVVPPASGICHQVNLEYLADVVSVSEHDGMRVAHPDTVLGTDSHTPMINGLGVLGWGVGGIDAEAAMLGQPVVFPMPEVVGVQLTGKRPTGTTATDLVLLLTERLRQAGVVGCFVEFFGKGLSSMSVPDRATLSNMAPEYGATVGYFPVDRQTLDYLKLSGRSPEGISLVERYCREQGLFRSDAAAVPTFGRTLTLDLSTVEPAMAGPTRPQDRVLLADSLSHWQAALRTPPESQGFGLAEAEAHRRVTVVLDSGQSVQLGHGAVVMAAITSCTNTSNPRVMLAAGLLARNAVRAGLTRKPWVKTSLAPGSRVVTSYLTRAGVIAPLEQLGFHVVGYGCTTCIGNSGPLPDAIGQAIVEHDLAVAAVLSGNRNFSGRVHNQIRAAYLASPPLVVAAALAGRMDIDYERDPLGVSADGTEIMLRDLWPTETDVEAALSEAVATGDFSREYTGVEHGNEAWEALPVKGDVLYEWDADSSYIREPSFFLDLPEQAPPIAPIQEARVLVNAGDSVTTDHISPAGAFAADTPAGEYLQSLGVTPEAFNSYGSRRGNDAVMVRGTFANVRLRNRLAQGREGGWTSLEPDGPLMTIHGAAERCHGDRTPLIVLAGKDYGMGSSRDWAAKGPALLGVKAVIAQSYERIHRSNLVGMGILPLQFPEGVSAETLGLSGYERYTIHVSDAVQAGDALQVEARTTDGSRCSFNVVCRLDSASEVVTYRNGGILHAVLRRLLA
ncbi:MAG: aconitate hydratase AcnA [Lentisphaerae bacterium]|nr:aconitate hydratase AcnA [Lentisphaerota bacterium]MBT4822893.1 aconitate hydratase AcnA [Lentisphaerota bacterium]MBT5608119.1 aconitate hydratase AcnA [Lentisphaerota bacterium]MBT7060604.1 aconitate hydratase AcnA [Lentisphaerota bacterium]MBT7847703.1 aconitate hydratase AcnA [Lentisphaerota bacterium]